MAGAQERWTLVAINSGWILDPSLTSRTDSMSIKTMIAFNNTRSRDHLGMTYIPVAQTLRDHFQQLLDDGLLS